jgi:F-type H+-transporting ATPase subunit b
MRHALWLLPVLFVLCALPAHAADAAEHGSSPGITTIDVFSVGMSIAVFVVLLIVLTKFAWRPILTGLKAREATIQKAVDDAAAASEKAQAIMREYEGRLATASQEAQAILEEGRKDALTLKATIEADARKAAEESTARGVREIEQARATAWDSIVRDAAKLATDAAAKIIRKNLDTQGHAALVDEVVAEVAAARRGKRG